MGGPHNVAIRSEDVGSVDGRGAGIAKVRVLRRDIVVASTGIGYAVRGGLGYGGRVR